MIMRTPPTHYHQAPTGRWHYTRKTTAKKTGFLDERGASYPSKAAAIRASRENHKFEETHR